MLEKVLEKLGLSEKEAKVYLALLGMGQTTVQAIAKKAGVVRPTTYVILETLSKKGLATTVEKNGKVYFAAEPPDQLKQFLAQQEREIEHKVEELKRALPEFQSVFALSGDRPTMRFYEGKDGVDSSDEDAFRSLKPGEEFYSFTPVDEMLKVYPDALKAASEHRLTFNIWTNVIYSSLKGKIPALDSDQSKRRARYLPIKQFPFRTIITIVPGKRVQITALENRIFAVVIEDPTVADTFKAIWDLVWQIAQD